MTYRYRMDAYVHDRKPAKKGERPLPSFRVVDGEAATFQALLAKMARDAAAFERRHRGIRVTWRSSWAWDGGE